MNTNFTYIQMPLFLFTCDRYVSLSSNAKLLYSIILNRMKLSEKNKEKFQDENGIFVYFSNTSIIKNINCSKNTATRILNELEQAGLIRKEYQRIGQPIKIYVIDVFEMHNNTYKSQIVQPKKQNFKPHSPEKQVSFDVEKANRIANDGTLDFGSMKNKKRRKH